MTEHISLVEDLASSLDTIYVNAAVFGRVSIDVRRSLENHCNWIALMTHIKSLKALLLLMS